MTSSVTVAVDLAKTVFEIAIADSDWRIVERHRLSRSHSRYWPADRHRAGGGGRHPGQLPGRASSGGVDGLDAPACRQWPSHASGRHLQTRGSLSADAAHPWRQIGTHPSAGQCQGRQAAQPVTTMGAGSSPAIQSQQDHLCASQQARPDCLGRLGA